MLPTIAREDGAVVMIDQRKLPAQEVYVRCETAAEVARAIKTMVIRGAPAIGVAAAMGIALGMRTSKATGTQKFAAEFYKTCELMAGTRPTAVNLFWALEQLERNAFYSKAARRRESVGEIRVGSRRGPVIEEEDLARCRAMGAYRRRGRPSGRPRPDALQCRRAGNRRLRHCPRRHQRRGGAG